MHFKCRSEPARDGGGSFDDQLPPDYIHPDTFIQPARPQVVLQNPQIDKPFTPLLKDAESMQQQRSPKSPALHTRVYHQILDIRTGPALRHANHTLGIAGNEAQ
jgi:hypothetical protein